jgi:hypothetical protein
MFERMAKLILHATSTSPRREVPLDGSPVSIGRDPTNDLVLADRTVSRRHAVIEQRGGRYCVRDCNSRNGSVVNGERVAERGLRSGDFVTIGATKLVFWEVPPVAQITQGPEGIAGPLTAQQESLIRAVVLNRADYLQRSCYRDPATGQRVAHSLEEDEWSRFAAGWAVEPIACIRAVNRAIAELRTPARIRRYLEAAVELETLMDRGTLRAPEARVFSGIPGYIMDGYTDMGRNPSPTLRGGREKIRVDKERLKPWLVETRWRALAFEPSLEELLAGFYEVVRRSLCFDESRVRDLSSEGNDRSVNLSRFLDDGVGVCRHQSILYQLCLQEAAVPGRVVKGTLHVYGLEGRHAWNLAWLGGRVALVDVTLPTRKAPLIVVGASQEEVYRLANRGERRYVPTPDQENHYKIGSPVDRGLLPLTTAALLPA